MERPKFADKSATPQQRLTQSSATHFKVSHSSYSLNPVVLQKSSEILKDCFSTVKEENVEMDSRAIDTNTIPAKQSGDDDKRRAVEEEIQSFLDNLNTFEPHRYRDESPIAIEQSARLLKQQLITYRDQLSEKFSAIGVSRTSMRENSFASRDVTEIDTIIKNCKTVRDDTDGPTLSNVVRPYSNTELRRELEANGEDFCQRKQSKSIYYQESLKDAIQVIIEKLDEKIFDGETSGNHSRKTSAPIEYTDVHRHNEINHFDRSDNPIVVSCIGTNCHNYNNISQIMPSRIGTNRPSSLDLTDNAILQNLNRCDPAQKPASIICD